MSSNNRVIRFELIEVKKGKKTVKINRLQLPEFIKNGWNQVKK